jgi:hypothetical protein
VKLIHDVGKFRLLGITWHPHNCKSLLKESDFSFLSHVRRRQHFFPVLLGRLFYGVKPSVVVYTD